MCIRDRLSPQSQSGSKWIHEEVMVFYVVEPVTSKWTHGEVAVFDSTVYKIFTLKFQKLRTPLAPCVDIVYLYIISIDHFITGIGCGGKVIEKKRTILVPLTIFMFS